MVQSGPFWNRSWVSTVEGFHLCADKRLQSEIEIMRSYQSDAKIEPVIIIPVSIENPIIPKTDPPTIYGSVQNTNQSPID